MHRPSRRYIGSKNLWIDIYNYKKYIHQQFANHRIYEKSKDIFELSHSINNHHLIESKLNKLDTQITEIMLSSENQFCRTKQQTEWSVELHQVSIICNHWIKRYKGLKNGVITLHNKSRHYMTLFQQKGKFKLIL